MLASYEYKRYTALSCVCVFVKKKAVSARFSQPRAPIFHQPGLIWSPLREYWILLPVRAACMYSDQFSHPHPSSISLAVLQAAARRGWIGGATERVPAPLSSLLFGVFVRWGADPYAAPVHARTAERERPTDRGSSTTEKNLQSLVKKKED
jgi:hypothetical protein